MVFASRIRLLLLLWLRSMASWVLATVLPYSNLLLQDIISTDDS